MSGEFGKVARGEIRVWPLAARGRLDERVAWIPVIPVLFHAVRGHDRAEAGSFSPGASIRVGVPSKFPILRRITARVAWFHAD